MGIKCKNINTFLRSKSPNAFQSIDMLNFRNKKIAIDSSALIYKYVSTINKITINEKNLNLPDKKTIKIILTDYLVKFILKFMSYDIVPIFVFDNKNISSNKDDERKIRKEKKEKQLLDIEKLKEENNIPKLISSLRNYISIDSKIYLFVQKLLSSIHIPYLVSNDEADKLCSMLCEYNYVSAVYSNDTDYLAYNCPIYITNINDNYFSCVINSILLQDLNFTRYQLTDMCILCGTDYNPKLYLKTKNNKLTGCGSATAFKLITKHGSIKNVLLENETAEFEYVHVQNIFLSELPSFLVESQNFETLNIDYHTVNLNNKYLNHDLENKLYMIYRQFNN